MFGGINYLLKHPIRGPVALYHRLKFPILKRSITQPFTTPEGIEVESNQALITWAQMFVEQLLYDDTFIREYKRATGANVIDVGANYGMFTSWLGSYNNTTNFICIEPYPPFLEKGKRNTSKLRTKWINAAASCLTGPIKLYRGGLLTCKKPVLVEEEILVDTVRLDSLDIDVFLLKIDTDGHSTEVLEGASELLKRTRHVLIEDEDGLDFDKFFHPNSWKRTVLPSGCDFLFTNPRVKPPVH